MVGGATMDVGVQPWAPKYAIVRPTLSGEPVASTAPPLKLAVDATSLLDRPTGVGVFTREILSRLGERPDLDVTAFTVTWRGRDGLAEELPPGVRPVGPAVPARVARTVWRHSDQLTADWLASGPDVVHGPNFVVPPGGGAAEVVTIHDLTAVRYPEMCTPDVLAWPGLLRRALARGAWVHTVSESVATEVREAFPEAGDRVVPVPNGITRPAPPSGRSGASRGYHLAGGTNYLLALGTVEPRKDLPGLVEAFDVLATRHRDLRLVIAGPDGWGAEALTAARDRCRHRGRIVRLGWVDDESRSALLRGASVVAYPSRYEGFGLVPLEALAVGTPVVATAVGALPEVLGEAVPLVPAGDPAALARAVDRVLTDRSHRADLLARGAARVAHFSWDRTAEGLVELYRRAAAARR